MLKGAAFRDAELEKTVNGIVHAWTEVQRCNSYRRELAQAVKESVRAAGGTQVASNALTPGAAHGGPIAFVRDGDRITFDVEARRLDVDADIEARRAGRSLRERASRHAFGVMAKYAAIVSSASDGEVTRPCPSEMHHEGARR
ncbi:MAG TPA: dihydroxy-acid dehydratase [Labilithrix sp.]|nr:dihydroxy-acid dehydratase [Labilithrix sp.]